MNVQKYQDKLIRDAASIYSHTPLSEKVKAAFYEVPRHQFIPRYRRGYGSDRWITINEKNLDEHLPILYADHPLVIFGDESDFKKTIGTQFVSTISQPTFVLRMLDILKLEAGQKVFELGTGSGWNAALLGKIVGPQGKVVSVEIIPELIDQARASIKSVNLENVEVHNADGGDGWAPEAPYDRAIFTAGSYDLPRFFYDQIKPGGLLLFVLKNKGGSDTLFLLEKKDNHFESIYSMACGFVPLTGKYHVKNMEEVSLDDLIKDSGIDDEVIAYKNFWWESGNAEYFIWSTFGLKFFLTITEKDFVPIRLDNGKKIYGLWDKGKKSLAVVYNDRIESYGNLTAQNRLLDAIENWIDLEMPTDTNFKLKVYPVDKKSTVAVSDWVSYRNESKFIWTLMKKVEKEKPKIKEFF